MVGGRFTLGDRLGAKTVNCRVRGCKRTWLDVSANPVLASGGDQNQGLCEPCRKKFATLADRTLPCSRPGCYELFSPHRRSPLKKFCSSLCREALRRVRQRELHWRRYHSPALERNGCWPQLPFS